MPRRKRSDEARALADRRYRQRVVPDKRERKLIEELQRLGDEPDPPNTVYINVEDDAPDGG